MVGEEAWFGEMSRALWRGALATPTPTVYNEAAGLIRLAAPLLSFGDDSTRACRVWAYCFLGVVGGVIGPFLFSCSDSCDSSRTARLLACA